MNTKVRQNFESSCAISDIVRFGKLLEDHFNINNKQSITNEIAMICLQKLLLTMYMNMKFT